MKFISICIVLAAAGLGVAGAHAEPGKDQASDIQSRLTGDMAQAQQRAEGRMSEVKGAAQRMQVKTQGMSLDEMRKRYNQPPKDKPCDAEPCADHEGHEHGALNGCDVPLPVDGGLCDPEKEGRPG